MRLTPPKKWVFWVSVILGVVGLVAYFVSAIAAFAFWFVFVGLALLVAGLVLKGF